MKGTTKLTVYIIVISFLFKRGYLQKTVEFTNNQIHEHVENRKTFQLAKKKYLNKEDKNIRLNNRTKLMDLLGPISVEIEREEETIFQLPKPSTIIKSSLALGMNKIKDINANKNDPTDQINKNQNKLIQNILEESSLGTSNESIIDLEEVLREYKN